MSVANKIFREQKIWKRYTTFKKNTHITCEGMLAQLEFALRILTAFRRARICLEFQMSRLMTKPTKWHMHSAKTQISLGICLVWSESSLSTWRKLGYWATHWAHSEGSDQSGRMPRMIWVFAGRTVILLVLSWGGSNLKLALNIAKNYSSDTLFHLTCTEAIIKSKSTSDRLKYPSKWGNYRKLAWFRNLMVTLIQNKSLNVMNLQQLL